jgi:hypothetical protein
MMPLTHQELTSTPSRNGDGPARVDIGIHGRLPLDEMVDAACAALAQANDHRFPRVLVRGNTLVRVAERGVLEDLGVDATRDELSRVAQCWTMDRQGNPVPIDPPMDVARTLLSRDTAEYGNLPRVDRLVDVPVLSAGGKLITEEGHHPDDRLYYLPADGLEGVRPADITSADAVVYARNLILDLFADFDFADAASRANAIGMSFVPFVRDFIGDYPTPLHAPIGPQPGVGKTYLAQAAFIPGCGFVDPQGATTDDEEWRKRVTSTLLQGKPAILLDNLNTVKSATLAASLTSPGWEDRILGESRMVSLPNRAAWAVTGNNLAVSPENLQRMVWIELDPGDNDIARDRRKEEFRHPDLHGWARENRAQLVSAYLTMIAFWLEGLDPASGLGTEEGVFFRHLTDEAGDVRRLETERTMGSFERYAEVIGGILHAAGIHGFLGNREMLRVELDDESADAADFLGAWHDLHRDPMQVSEIARLCTLGGELSDSLPAELMGQRDLGQKLSYWLRSHNGARLGGYQLLKEEGRRNRWSVRALDPQLRQ